MAKDNGRQENPDTPPRQSKRRRKQLRKHNGLASGKGCVASYFSVVPPSSPGSSPHPPCAGVTSGARAATSAALVARGAKVAATLCSVRVRRIFQAIDEFGRVVAAAIPARVVGGARIRMRRVRVSMRAERALRLLRPSSSPFLPPPPPPSPLQHGVLPPGSGHRPSVDSRSCLIPL